MRNPEAASPNQESARLDIILETRGLTKSFGGFIALNAVDLRVRRGSIHALIGPNGAGKTTCFNLLSKFVSPTAGRILFNGRDITDTKPADIARLGIARSFQISAVFPHLSARENVRLALQRRLATSFYFWRSERSLEVLDQRTLELLNSVGLLDFAEQAASELPYGGKRALEIATTLALEPEMLLLDEPTAGMGREDIGRVSDLIRQASLNRTVLLVEHNLGVVADLCDIITVLHQGRILAEGTYAQISCNPKVTAAYMGARHE